MSENCQPSSIPLNDIIQNANVISYANHVNGQQMDKLFEDLATKAEEYHTRWLKSEAKVDAMKNVIAKQQQQIYELHKQLDKMLQKHQLVESTAQGFANKYHDVLDKLKTVLLESAADGAEAGGDGNESVDGH